MTLQVSWALSIITSDSRGRSWAELHWLSYEKAGGRLHIVPLGDGPDMGHGICGAEEWSGLSGTIHVQWSSQFHWRAGAVAVHRFN